MDSNTNGKTSTTTTAPLTIDLKLTHESIQRRFSCPSKRPSWSALAAQIKHRFGLPADFILGLSYIDEVGENVVLSSDNELEHVWPAFNDINDWDIDSFPPLRFIIVELPASQRGISEETTTLISDDGVASIASGVSDIEIIEDDERPGDKDDEHNKRKKKEKKEKKPTLQDDIATFIDTVKGTVQDNEDIRKAFESVVSHLHRKLPEKKKDGLENQEEADDIIAISAVINEETGKMDSMTAGIVSALLAPALMGPPPHHSRGHPPHHGRPPFGKPPHPPFGGPMGRFDMPPPPPPGFFHHPPGFNGPHHHPFPPQNHFASGLPDSDDEEFLGGRGRPFHPGMEMGKFGRGRSRGWPYGMPPPPPPHPMHGGSPFDFPAGPHGMIMPGMHGRHSFGRHGPASFGMGFGPHRHGHGHPHRHGRHSRFFGGHPGRHGMTPWEDMNDLPADFHAMRMDNNQNMESDDDDTSSVSSAESVEYVGTAHEHGRSEGGPHRMHGRHGMRGPAGPPPPPQHSHHGRGHHARPFFGMEEHSHRPPHPPHGKGRRGPPPPPPRHGDAPPPPPPEDVHGKHQHRRHERWA